MKENCLLGLRNKRVERFPLSLSLPSQPSSPYPCAIALEQVTAAEEDNIIGRIFPHTNGKAN